MIRPLRFRHDKKAWLGTILLGGLLAPIVSSAGLPHEPAEFRIFAVEDAPHEAPQAPDAVTTTVECTARFDSGRYFGYCAAYWHQRGNIDVMYVHNGFHNFLVTSGYKALYWVDPHGRMIHSKECSVAAESVDVPVLPNCKEKTASHYYEGHQTLWIFGDETVCYVGQCILHGRLELVS